MKLRDCAVCGGPVEDRRYQSIAARCCSPGCARDLAYREEPGLGGGGVWSERHKALADKLNGEGS